MKATTKNPSFLADTYALLEIIRGSPSYKPYVYTDLLTTTFNLIELYYQLLKDQGSDVADTYLRDYTPLVISISSRTIRYGMKFKLQHKKEKLSYVDCIGYALALELGRRFLTGDQKFKDKPNVEFVK